MPTRDTNTNSNTNININKIDPEEITFDVRIESLTEDKARSVINEYSKIAKSLSVKPYISAAPIPEKQITTKNKTTNVNNNTMITKKINLGRCVWAITELLVSNKTIDFVAKQLDVTPDELNTALNKIGYNYDRTR